ncbi:MAG: tripartite tricarboxylate transporter substrate-binding protein, partial [Syntrophaceae bacterium]|nr:tripartite tricarboxylate transporter substrate-binding protein [Syntrophaceae bacterium]
GQMQAGRIRALLTVQKLKEFPNIPLFSQKGLGDAGIISPAGLIALSATPKDALTKLIDAFAKVAKDPKNIEKIEKLGFEGEYWNPAEMWEKSKRDLNMMDPIINRMGRK